ncbi:Dipeptidyl aminopeptidase/acylaminoacyl peptidase [Salinibacillus kushneri]|uniref:Dipeptidyl aminopeptidase/acylaminoacyl peptidase n=1 Tax=Salinibacillus kushneri TaxID=237682 RepID=A0A1I0EU65_9BACI|nr:S9 family peptidase [Salinibacillus kushneri]SET48836.1 Dipeptidyl aminopeptidase/acylaminoacyl peptidase [Salinibacillus kushneri]
MSVSGITAEDLLNFTFISDPQVSPDGNWVVFVKRTMNKKENYQSSLYVMNTKTKESIPFTQGDSKDTHPRWSPDGNMILFTSNHSGTNQIWKISFHGGEAQQITFFKNGASQPVWSPDSRSILCATQLKENQSIHEEETDKKDEKDEQPKPYITTRLKYKANGQGLLEEKFSQLVLIDLERNKITQLTEGNFYHHNAAFSPDGKRIAFAANRSENPDDTMISDIFELELDNLNLTKLTNSHAVFSAPNYSHNGKTLSLLGHDFEYQGATLTRVWTLDLDTKHLTCLTSDWDVEVNDVAINDMATGSGSPGAIWTSNDDGLYVLASNRGNTHLYYISLDQTINPVLGGTRQIYAIDFDKYREQAVIGVSNPEIPGDLYHVSLPNLEETRLTEANESWMKDKDLTLPEEIEIPARDGISLQGWIMKPVDCRENETYPLIVEIHGGPHMMYSNSFMHEFQVFAEKGYGVLFMNPRGSHGYGQTFVDAVRGDYGGKDYEDIMDAVNYAVKNFDWIDENRLGVTGGSYGGFMTNWIVGHTNRFKAAATQRSISNWISFYGVSDIGYFFTDWEHKTYQLDDPEKLWKHSPIRYINNVETPLLILHGEEDHRCPIEQGEQMYVALKSQHKPTKFVRFPESDHELSRNGKPNLRIRRLNEMVAWFNKYL